MVSTPPLTVEITSDVLQPQQLTWKARTSALVKNTARRVRRTAQAYGAGAATNLPL